jgi:hypothetical protein
MKLLSLALLLTLAAPAQVQNQLAPKKRHAEAAIIWSGNQIYDLCQHYKADRLKGSLGPGCFMYIAGVTQTLVLNDDTKMMTSPCPGKEVTDEQVTDVVIKWMDDHPEKRDLAAPYIVMESLNKAFPCN